VTAIQTFITIDKFLATTDLLNLPPPGDDPVLKQVSLYHEEVYSS
jgi:hypothetical protein